MTTSLLKFMIVLLIWVIKGSNEIQNVKMILPPTVQAGSTATLLCLYDLEGASLYSVQWYRGKYEFFRFVPKDNPQTKVFEIPGLYVDVRLKAITTFASNEHQVTLRNIPLHISGEFSCEITTDAPRFSTSCVSENLTVIDFSLILTVPKKQYYFGDDIDANCSLVPRLSFTKIKFYWNGKLVPDENLSGQFSESVSLHLNTSIFYNRQTLPVLVELKCSANLDKMYYLKTKSVFLKLKPPDLTNSKGVKPQTWLFLIYFFLFFNPLFLLRVAGLRSL